MSGSFSIIRELYGIYVGVIPPRSLFWSFTIVAFVLSAGTLWVIEYRARVAAETKLATTSNAEAMRAKWEDMSKKFNAVTHGQPQISAIWTKRDDSNQLSWFLDGTWDEMHREEFEIVVEDAGNLLMQSELIREKYPTILLEANPVFRWYAALYIFRGDKLKPSGTWIEHGVTGTSGDLKDVPSKSVNLCDTLAVRTIKASKP